MIPAAFIAFMSAIAALVGGDLALNPNSPPAIFAAQFEAAFGRPPSLPSPKFRRRNGKHIFVTRL